MTGIESPSPLDIGVRLPNLWGVQSLSRRFVRRCSRGLAVALVGGAAWAHGPLHEQIQLLSERLAKSPDDGEFLSQRAELYRAHGLFPEARADTDALERILPGNITNRLRQGLIDLGARETNSAVENLKLWNRARPDDLSGNYALAQALSLAGCPGQAVPHYHRVIAGAAQEGTADSSQNGARPELYLERAKAQLAARVPVVEILAGVDAGITRLGPLPVLERFAAELEMERGNPDAAVDRIGAIAARADRRERWLFQQGELLLRAGRTNAAREKFVAARDALAQLPEKLQRAWVATELRRQIDTRLAGAATTLSSPTHP
jgi:tetratricopeptide (TPR) repeat protein